MAKKPLSKAELKEVTDFMENLFAPLKRELKPEYAPKPMTAAQKAEADAEWDYESRNS